MTCKTIILFFCFSYFLTVNSQNIKFEHYNDNSGLSHNSVRYISQDNNGFMWFGTFSGLNRFDGYQFKSYLSSSSGENKILNDDITALEYDQASNDLWVGTRKGLTLFKSDTGVFKNFLSEKDNPKSLQDEEIRSLHIDRFKRVWVGTKTKGVYLFHPKENRFEKVFIDGFEYVKEIFEDKNGHIWIGSFGTASVAKITLDTNGTVVKITDYTLSIPNLEEKNPYINFIYEDAKRDIFVGTREGLYKLDKEVNTFKNLYIEDDEIRRVLGPYFLTVVQGPNGKYWVGTLGGILECDHLEDINKGKYKWHYSILSDDTSLVDNLVYALYFDDAGVLWIGTEDGLDKYDPYENQFFLNKGISRYIGNQAPRIRGFSKAYDDKIITATRHNGLFISDLDGGVVPLYNNQKDIASIYSNDGKTFYCGLWNGKILVYNYIANTSKEIDVGFEASAIFTFTKITDSKIMVGSFGEGAVILNTENLQIEDAKSKLLPGFAINSIEKDKAGNVWFATQTGIVKYVIKSEIIETYKLVSNKVNGLVNDEDVSDVMVDNNGKVYVSTRTGLSYYDSITNGFKYLTEPKELVGKWITDLVTDTNGDLWLNINNNSVARLKSNLKDINVYQVNSGNRLDVFSSSGFYNVEGSNIYLGGKNGIIYFHPQAIIENEWSPTPIITEFKIHNKEVLPGMEINGQVPLEKDLNFSKRIELDYKNRNFSLQFSAPSFSDTKLNKFEYMLEGFDKDWINTSSNSRTIQYTNLFSGDYVFKIRASNSYGYWSKTESYQIKIVSPFWLTPIAFVLFAIVFLFLFYFIRRELKNRSKLKQELLTEKVSRERDVKLNNEKLRFFTNISHELRTPLTLILGPSKQLIEESKTYATDYQKSRYKLIHDNANRLLNLVNQVLDFRKSQTGELKLKVSKTDIIPYAKNIFDSFKELAFNKHIQLNFNSDLNEIIGWIDNDKLDKILYNLLSNALKFTNKYGNVDLFVKLKDGVENMLVVEVSDNGIGIPLKSQEKIFTRFYQTTNSKKHNTGSGIGLSLVKSLIELHKGVIAVESELDKGSVFTVEIPIDRDSYQDHEVFEYGFKQTIEEPLPNIAAKKIIQSTELKQKILVVEDNVELRKYLVDYLSDYYKVYEADNGINGLKICRKRKPILCVTDVMMPIMGGLEFCEELKNDEFISHIPVVMLTALSDNEDKVKGYGTGADGYLVKPFDPSLLKTVIENIIKSRLELKSKFSGEVESEVGLLTHSPIDEELMNKVTNLINKNLSEVDFSTDFICKELGVSASKLYRKIKELTDLAPNEFIRTMRLKKSAQLLKTKKYNVSEVTNLVGFNDPLYFSRCFKKQFGFPPSKLIK